MKDVLKCTPALDKKLVQPQRFLFFSRSIMSWADLPLQLTKMSSAKVLSLQCGWLSLARGRV